MASSKRERELARMRAERQAARRAAAEAARKARQRTLAIVGTVVAVLAIVLAVVLTQDGGSSDKLASSTPSSSASAAASASASAASGGECTYADAAAAAKKVSGKPPTSGVAKTTQAVTLTTNQGVVELSLNGAKAPCTVNSFTFLTKQKYFDDTPCHRLTTSGIYVLQCGDPSGQGNGGPGYQYADENLTGATYPRGTLAMANAGPGTNGSQFFLVYKDTQLPPSYTPFGTITKGLDVLDKIAAGGTVSPTGDGKPKISVTIEKAALSPA